MIADGAGPAHGDLPDAGGRRGVVSVPPVARHRR